MRLIAYVFVGSDQSTYSAHAAGETFLAQNNTRAFTQLILSFISAA